MDRKPEFLEKVKVSNFSRSVRVWDGANNKRKVVKDPNKEPEAEYTVVGKKMFNEGISVYIGYEEGYGFEMTGRKTLYAVANGMKKILYAAIEDMEVPQ